MMERGSASLVTLPRNAMVTSYSDSNKVSECTGDAADVAVAEWRKVILEVTKRRFGQLLVERVLAARTLFDPRIKKMG